MIVAKSSVAIIDLTVIIDDKSKTSNPGPSIGQKVGNFVGPLLSRSSYAEMCVTVSFRKIPKIYWFETSLFRNQKLVGPRSGDPLWHVLTTHVRTFC